MAITDRQYSFIISLCEWNSPDVADLDTQSRVPTRVTLNDTLIKLRDDAIAGGFRRLSDINQFMIDYLRSLSNDEVAWFRGIEAQIRANYG